MYPATPGPTSPHPAPTTTSESTTIAAAPVGERGSWLAPVRVPRPRERVTAPVTINVRSPTRLASRPTSPPCTIAVTIPSTTKSPEIRARSYPRSRSAKRERST